MPLLNSIATPYAEALIQVAEARKETDTVAEQAKEVLAVLNSSPELQAALASPLLEPDAKKAALGKIFNDQVTPSVQNLLKLLADRQRLSHQWHNWAKRSRKRKSNVCLVCPLFSLPCIRICFKSITSMMIEIFNDVIYSIENILFFFGSKYHFFDNKNLIENYIPNKF